MPDTKRWRFPLGSPASGALPRHEVVSSESEQLILVDSSDCEVGHASKADAHNGDGTLHRAFSLFIFDDRGQLLLQQRAKNKRLWGGFWSNSCCSHPRRGEVIDEAVHRRLEQELGMRAELSYVYKFEYQAQFGDLGAEHELCHVYLGRAKSEVRANSSEIEDWRFVARQRVASMIADDPDAFTPWFKLEWEKLTNDHRLQLDRWSGTAS